MYCGMDAMATIVPRFEHIARPALRWYGFLFAARQCCTFRRRRKDYALRSCSKRYDGTLETETAPGRAYDKNRLRAVREERKPLPDHHVSAHMKTAMDDL